MIYTHHLNENSQLHNKLGFQPQNVLHSNKNSFFTHEIITGKVKGNVQQQKNLKMKRKRKEKIIYSQRKPMTKLEDLKNEGKKQKTKRYQIIFSEPVEFYFPNRPQS